MSNLMDRLPTNTGNKTPVQVMDDLRYISYATQIDAGMSHQRARNLYNLDFHTALRYYYLYIFQEFGNINKN